MTYRETIEEQMKTPPIGTEAWFKCIPSEQSNEAHRLITAKLPVCVEPQTGAGTPTFFVLFDGTEFVAGGFNDRSLADTFALEWNSKL